jgi:hypothetical protein
LTSYLFGRQITCRIKNSKILEGSVATGRSKLFWSYENEKIIA